MARGIVRDSKFRHVFAEELKTKYEDLRPSSKASETLGIRGNSKFFAMAWESGGGGTLAVIQNSRFGRLPRDIPLIAGHSGGILDFEFNPFNDNQVMTASEDTHVKVWAIPDDGLTEHLREPLATLSGHQKKVSFCTYNPVADNVTASAAFDHTVRIWDVAESEEIFQVTVPDQVMSMKWSPFGNLISVTSKDKKMRIIDPRTQAFVGETKIHDGAKASKVEWLGGGPGLPAEQDSWIMTTGFSAAAERQLAIWDMRTFGAEDVEALNLLCLDQGTGALFPFFDPGTNMVYIAGKGDGNVRYFELSSEDPYIYFISQYGSQKPQKGFTFIPKRCVDTGVHEVMKGLKLEANSVIPISFRVPRKSDTFQEDLYPDCISGAPSIASAEWSAGDAEVRPSTVKMSADMSGGATPKAAATPKAGGVMSVKELKASLAEALARVEALEKENELLKTELAKYKPADAEA